MKKNIGTTDRVIRLFIALVLVTLYFADVLAGPIALFLAIVFTVTALVSICPFYRIFSIGTHHLEKL